ncbi:MAG TPA: bifunctional DNA-formamidopyrimidine glycosylase/DNA-(apurinic or apyrimidinic site) lyase [Smithellaceae bacterium]|jgi:formamidopyrimidine-DNA glycosylase|nr:bifunctional DNA-formamidopyrimidine glycosylase/DNA-(apurinic or apyrimidinic site) lyase [Smithellaceae bacterium]HPL66904.1 bifunctional DNA-formamidopyrimidine glycosylase/DNA-(apurinic or apyrimidinic site) lyase [Smithellaceae bacterium]
MPELLEVETLCRQLHQKVVGAKILLTIVLDEKLAGLEDITECVIDDVRRYGKTIHLILNDGRSVLIHLRMSGRLFWKEQETKEPYTRWRMETVDGNIDLIDPRRFATVEIVKTRTEKDEKDLLQNFSRRTFLERQVKRKVSVKVLLMDPQAISGIGNIYACEILHRAGISPFRQVSSIGNDEWMRIFKNAKRVLKRGIEKRGTSISDWCDLYGRSGEYQKDLKVYGKEGKPCGVCGSFIKRVRQSGRSTYYCPLCQE